MVRGNGGPAPGRAVAFGFGGRGAVTDLEPPRLFAFTWGDEHPRWELHPDGTGTRLVRVHTFDDRAGAASFAAGRHTSRRCCRAWPDSRTPPGGLSSGRGGAARASLQQHERGVRVVRLPRCAVHP